MHRGKVIFNREISPGYLIMSVSVPEGFEIPDPGQFVMIKFRDRLDPLLGRPLSVYAFERQRNGGVFEVLYRASGKGTNVMSKLHEGDDIELLGPLGTGYHMPSSISHVVLIAGGMGVAPITYLAYHYRRRISSFLKITCYLGSKSSDNLLGLERLQDLCTEVIITTDDGSMGTCGFVTDAFCQDLEYYQKEDTFIYACGPKPMMKCLADYLGESAVSCQVSLEERMACGVGACLGCAVSLKNRMGNTYFGRVCKDGPVFNIRHINWDE
jgi:dihydroorotate dehydrogenase electron transfer subunit